MGLVLRILLTVLAFPWRRPPWFCAVAVLGGAAVAAGFLQGVRWAETAGLALLGAVSAAVAAAVWLAAATPARDRMVQEDLRRQTAQARAAAEQRSHRDFAEFLEQCVREEGDTPVWKSDGVSEEP